MSKKRLTFNPSILRGRLFNFQPLTLNVERSMLDVILSYELIAEGLGVEPLNGVLNQSRGVVERKFFFDVCAVRFYRFYAQMQILSDLAGGVSFSDKTEDFKLAVA